MKRKNRAQVESSVLSKIDSGSCSGLTQMKLGHMKLANKAISIPSSFLKVEQNNQFNPSDPQLCDLRLSVPTDADEK